MCQAVYMVWATMMALRDSLFLHTVYSQVGITDTDQIVLKQNTGQMVINVMKEISVCSKNM